ncbi:MAG: hypothetical protein ACKVOE_04035 [Rickettsiales bacterium]
MSAKHATGRDRLYQMLYTWDLLHLSPAQQLAFTNEMRAGYTVLDGYVSTLMQRDARIDLRQAPSQLQTLSQLGRAYGEKRPAGLGIKQGEFISLSPREAGNETQLIATDYLLDCNAIALVARDRQGHVLRTTLSHINVGNRAERALQQLLATMPAGATVEATLISSYQNGNPYRQQELLQLLAAAPQLARIHFYRQQSSTVAIDVHTGQFFFSRAQDFPDTAYRIDQLPMTIRFSDYDPNKPTVQTLTFAHAQRYHRGVSPLVNAYDASRHRFTNAGVVSAEIGQMQQQGATRERLGHLVGEISRWMEQPVQVQFAPAADAKKSQTRFELQTARGETLGGFTASASGLPLKGRVQSP